MEKYVAIKVKGLKHWIWFDAEKVKRENGTLVGRDGWGRGGACTHLSVDESLIEGELESSELQYV